MNLPGVGWSRACNETKAQSARRDMRRGT